MLTGLPNHPTGVVPPEYRGRARFDERMGAVRVLRTWLYATPNEGIAKKTLGHLSFMVTSVVLGMGRTGPVDVVVVSSPTFFSILSAWMIAKRRRARFVLEVRDLWPAIFVELGVLRNRAVIWLLERLELAAYRAADAVVVVTAGFKDDLVRRGIAPGKITVITNGVDAERFDLGGARPGEPRMSMGADEDDVLVLYIGAHGISHALETLLEAAATLRGLPMRVALVGEGAAKPDLLRRRDALGLDNTVMLDGVPPDDVPAWVAAADICVVTLRDIPLFETFIPSKLFELFAAGKPVVAAVAGEPAAIAAAAGAVVVAPEDPGALASVLRELALDPARRRAMGEEAAAFVRAHYDRGQLAEAYLGVLEGAVGGAP